MRPSAGTLVAALLLMAATTPVQAALVYLGFGDSITKSTACPIDCNTNFDEANKGGYVGRLETRLGGGRDVQNHGKGGEKTAQGLTRITSVLDGGGDVLLLMEGTNDISSGVSTESIRANLEAMVNKATTRGIDTVLATTIRRIFAANHTPTRNLATETRSLATQLDRDLADPYVPLCPDSGCFSAHYWQNEPDIGHIDASGYEIMTDVFEDVIRADATPAVPVPSAPTGNTDDRPTYQWTAVSDANWYRMQVEDPDNVRVLDDLYEGGDVCSGGTCSILPAGGLESGEHRFRVRSRNLFDRSAYSSWQTFQVYAEVPAKVVLDTPSGEFFDVDPIQFTYEWQAQDLVVDYRLKVTNGQGTKVIDELIAASVCSGSSCSTTPATGLGGGDYTWQVRGENPAGNGAYSTALALSVWDAAPGTVTPVYPLGELFDTTPVMQWQAASGASTYDIQVGESGGGIVALETFDATVCSGASCEASLATVLTPGDYEWTVRAVNPIGSGLWSPATAFTVLLCQAPVDVTLAPQVVTDTQTFRACGELTAADGFVIASTGVVTLHAGGKVILGDGFEVQPGGQLILLVDP